MNFRKNINYLSYVLKHKRYVFLECCRLKIPWLGIVHDLSKFLPSEWIPYVNWFHTPNLVEDGAYKKFLKKQFDVAWLRHQNRNPHHWEFWVLRCNINELPVCLPMPDHYRKEMLADLHGTGLTKTGKNDTKEWYKEHGHKMILHPETRDWLEQQIQECTQ